MKQPNDTHTGAPSCDAPTTQPNTPTGVSVTPSNVMHFITWILQNTVHSLWIFLVWSILGWLWYVGLQFAILAPLNYVTGAMLGLEEHDFLSGLLGRTLILVFLNGFFTTFINHKGKGKWNAAFHYCKNALANLIPYFQNLRQFSFQDRLTHTTNCIGIGIGLVLYALVTGNGARMATFSGVVLFVTLAGEAVQRRGIFIALLNLFLSCFGQIHIPRKPLDGIVNGAAIGTLLGTIYSLMFDTNDFVLWAGIFFTIGSIILFYFARQKLIKECVACED